MTSLFYAGSKEELSNTYKRIGMINALAELSTSPAVHQINTVAASISGFLMTCYKDDGKVKVFLSMLDALIQMDLSIVLPAIDRYKAGQNGNSLSFGILEFSIS